MAIPALIGRIIARPLLIPFVIGAGGIWYGAYDLTKNCSIAFVEFAAKKQHVKKYLL